MVVGDSKHTYTSISINSHMTINTFKDRGGLTAGGGRSLSLDASGNFRRVFQVFCLPPVYALSTYPSNCSCGREEEYF